jgi:hypothetical protein
MVQLFFAATLNCGRPETLWRETGRSLFFKQKSHEGTFLAGSKNLRGFFKSAYSANNRGMLAFMEAQASIYIKRLLPIWLTRIST